MYFIGKKDYLGIEFTPIEDSLNKRCSISIWVDNFSIGDPLNDDFFFVIVNGLRQILLESVTFTEFENKSDKEILEKILASDENNDIYDVMTIHMGECFDDYRIRAYKTIKNNIKLMVAGKKFNAKDPQAFNIISIVIDIKYLTSLVEQFVEEIKLLDPSFDA